MPTSQGINLALIITVVIAFSVGSIYLTMLALSRLTGWKKLAATYPGQAPAPNARTGFGSCGFHTLGNYNNCVRWASDDDHLHISLVKPFAQMGHPPISIPWAVIDIVDSKPGWGGFAKIKADNVPIRIPAKAISAELELRQALASESLAEPRGSSAPLA